MRPLLSSLAGVLVVIVAFALGSRLLVSPATGTSGPTVAQLTPGLPATPSLPSYPPPQVPTTPEIAPTPWPIATNTPLATLVPNGPIPNADLTQTPFVVPANQPSPADFPRDLPRLGPQIDPPQTIADDAKAANAIALVRIVSIDTPFFRNPTNTQPAKLDNNSLATPATLKVLKVYKGQLGATVNALRPGGCFGTPPRCVGEQGYYRWTDLVGYDFIAFFNPPTPNYYGRGQTYAYPFTVWVINPATNEVSKITQNNANRQPLTAMTGSLVAALAAGQ